MTTRDQARRVAGEPRTEAARADEGRAEESPPAPSLPERLYAARERKGVDLYRAERDTKIRARYLAALERGDYRELPGAVYTKGFLRNYALYLGLDPEDVLVQWRRERSDAKEGISPLVVPRPIVAPRQGLTFSPGIIVAALLTVGVLAFSAYLGIQLLRFAKPPTLAVTDPAVAVLEVDESTTDYVLRGTSIPGATISITTPGRDQPYRVSAGSDGSWSVDVELRRGKNQFEITATDPETGKQADSPVRVFITVPFLVIQAPTLSVEQPADGATFENGAIPVEGTTTNATRVVVKATWLGPAPQPGLPTDTEPSPDPSASPPPAPAEVAATIDESGHFATPVELTTGRWALTVTATSEQGKTTSLTRNVTIEYTGVNLAVTLKGGRAWLKVWLDGKLDPELGAAGKVIGDGRTLTFTAQESIEVRTGSSGVTHFTLNGTALGSLGRSGVPETWLFAPPDPPTKTQRR
jgi:cytoskeletal protein RodZ